MGYSERRQDRVGRWGYCFVPHLPVCRCAWAYSGADRIVLDIPRLYGCSGMDDQAADA